MAAGQGKPRNYGKFRDFDKKSCKSQAISIRGILNECQE